MHIEKIFHWLWDNRIIIAIVISFISLVLSVVGLVHPTTVNHRQATKHKLKKLWAERYTALHIAFFIGLTIYVFANWEECISMQFFAQFGGNNILFLVWVASIILSFYDVEAKGWKFRKKDIENTQSQYASAELNYAQKQAENLMNESHAHETEGSVE